MSKGKSKRMRKQLAPAGEQVGIMCGAVSETATMNGRNPRCTMWRGHGPPWHGEHAAGGQALAVQWAMGPEELTEHDWH